MNYNKDFKIGSGSKGFGLEYDRMNSDADGYNELLRAIKQNFSSYVQQGAKLFTTNTTGLWEAFLDGLPENARQHYTCRSCMRFIEDFGGLVTINGKGEMESVIWDEGSVPSFFARAIRAMRIIVHTSRVNGVFIPEKMNLGQPITGEWNHISVQVPRTMINSSKINTAEQVMAEKKEDFKMLTRAILDYPVNVIETALNLLRSDALYRSEKCLGVGEFFYKVVKDRDTTRNSRHKENIVWLSVANAPTGFTHIRSSMIGTLLDDIKDGLSYASVSSRFKEKMDPTKYQRPQSQPKSGNIAQAEKRMGQLGLTKEALERRFARKEELMNLWIPRLLKPTSPANGIFGHLKAKDSAPAPMEMNIPAKTMTWEKFLKTVLPEAESIEYYVPSGNANYSAIVTSLYPDTPPIMQWDKPEVGEGNPFSWYVYNNGSSPSRWGLRVGSYVPVTAITYQPSMWYGDYPNQSKSVFFLLDGAKDGGYANGSKGVGNALFPETLKSEFREIRSVIEAFSRGETIHGYEQSSAAGLRLEGKSTWNAQFRVKTAIGTAVYKLDRWD